MGERVAVEEVFPTEVGRRFAITIPVNVRKALAAKGIDVREGDQVRMAFIGKENDSKGSSGSE